MASHSDLMETQTCHRCAAMGIRVTARYRKVWDGHLKWHMEEDSGIPRTGVAMSWAVFFLSLKH